MMGERQVQHGALFYEFSLERHVPAEHLMRSIERFVELVDKINQKSPVAAVRPTASSVTLAYGSIRSCSEPAGGDR